MADGYGYGYGTGYPSWCASLYHKLNNNVLVILTSGGAFSAVTGVLSAVYPDYIKLVSGNIIQEIPLNRIAGISELAGGGPVPPVYGPHPY